MSPKSNLIFSLIHADREEEHEFPNILDKDESNQMEGQYLLREAAYNMIVGGGTSKTLRKNTYLQNSREREHTNSLELYKYYSTKRYDLDRWL